MPTDQDYIAAANEGDAEAFAALYERYRDWVFRLAQRFTGNREDALDVLQETFAYLLGKFPGFVLTASMTTFLYPVVKHLALASKQKARRVTSSDELLAGVAAPSVQGESELAAVLGVLPEEQREVLLLRFVDDLSLEEIGQALNIPLGTVKSRLHRALEAMRSNPRSQRYFQA